MNGIRNTAWCAIAFGIVACASTPMPVERLAVASNGSADSRQMNRRVEIFVSSSAAVISRRAASGVP